MFIVDSQIHIWENARMSAQHRQIPTYAMDDALKEMARGRGRRRGAASAQHARRGGQRAGGRGGQPHPGQILHSRTFRPAGAEPRGHRQELAATAGHARLPLHVQPAAPAELVDRRPLDWFWAACEREKLPVGLLAGGHMAAFRTIAERHPGLKLHIDHYGRGRRRRRRERRRRLRRSAARCWRWPSSRMSRSRFPARRAIRASLIRTATCTNTSADLRRVRSAALLLGHRYHPYAVQLPAMRDDVHRGVALAAGARPGAGHGAGDLRMARLEPARAGKGLRRNTAAPGAASRREWIPGRRVLLAINFLERISMDKSTLGAAAVGSVLVFGLSACTNPYDPAQRAIGGGLIGAGTGAAIGAAAGRGGAALGAAIGGAAGAIGGVATRRRRWRYPSPPGTRPLRVPAAGLYAPPPPGYYPYHRHRRRPITGNATCRSGRTAADGACRAPATRARPPLTAALWRPASAAGVAAAHTAAERLRSFPLRRAPVAAPVEIRWNEHLVPFIEATSDRDLAVALGLVHAHLRLAQMELLRRIAQGRLAEALGIAALPLDRAVHAHRHRPRRAGDRREIAGRHARLAPGVRRRGQSPHRRRPAAA